MPALPALSRDQVDALLAVADAHRVEHGRCAACGTYGRCPEGRDAREALAAAGIRISEWVPTLSGAPVRV